MAGRKIALIGSAPSSVALAPYHDDSWEIWGCSPGAYPVVKRANQWFELHRWEPPVLGDPARQKSWFSPEYVEWLRAFPGVLWMEHAVEDFPNAREYPVEEVLKTYGPYFFTSSLSWMFAAALQIDGLEELGLWGVDMSATEEYGYQRAGCHYFIQIARNAGIKITVPAESDLLQPPLLYGISESSPIMVKLLARQRELQGRVARARQMREQSMVEEHFINGALDDLTWVLNTWVGDRDPRVQRLMDQAGATTEVIQPKHSLGDDGIPVLREVNKG